MRAADRKLQHGWFSVLNEGFHLGGSLPFSQKKFIRFARLATRALTVAFPEACTSRGPDSQVIAQAFLARCPMPHLKIPAPNDWFPRTDAALAEYRRIATAEFGGTEDYSGV